MKLDNDLQKNIFISDLLWKFLIRLFIFNIILQQICSQTKSTIFSTKSVINTQLMHIFLVDDAARAAAEKQAESEAEKAAQQQQKRGIFEGMRLPNIIQRRLRRNNDIELGNGPNTRAGLASMETLDDSQKDIDKGSDVTDKAANGKEDDLETVKLDNSEVCYEKNITI